MSEPSNASETESTLTEYMVTWTESVIRRTYITAPSAEDAIRQAKEWAQCGELEGELADFSGEDAESNFTAYDPETGNLTEDPAG